MKQLKVPTIRELVVASILGPPTANSLTDAGAAPIAGLAVGAAVVVGNAWWSSNAKKTELKQESAVGYLLDVRNQLNPKTAFERARELVTRA